MLNQYAVIETVGGTPYSMQVFDTIEAARKSVDWNRKNDDTDSLVIVVRIIDFMEC